MEPLRDDQLIAELQALRPTPRPAYAAELDERVAAGFPRRRAVSLPPVHRRLRNVRLRRLLVPAGGLAALVIAVAAALVSSGGSTSEQIDLHSEMTRVPTPQAESGAASAAAAAGVQPRNLDFGTAIHHRDIERSAAITLGAAPEDVAGDSAKVFEAVHAHRGIVMRSSTSQGKRGEAGARFELLIPSRELGAALAAFSEIDTVRSRHEATADITGPTVSAAELLKESRARIDSLLGQLEAAETESEREAVEAELRHERRRASRLAAQLDNLHRRADYSRVLLRIETGREEEGAGGAWGFDDALHDAGRILAVAAAATLVALAVLGPIALIALLASLTHRAWVRRERRRALG